MIVSCRATSRRSPFECCGGATPNLALFRVFAVHFGVCALETNDVILVPDGIMPPIEREGRGRKIAAADEFSETARGVDRPASDKVLEAEIIHGTPAFGLLWLPDGGPLPFCRQAKTQLVSPEG